MKLGDDMKLYRIGNSEEKDIIMDNKSFLDVGKYFHDHKMNTFHYGDSRYMHFFSSKEHLIVFGISPERYIFTYEIPDEVVSKFQGIGYYYHPYDFNYLNSVEEYAIPSELVCFDYLESIEYISKEFCYANCLEELTSFLTEVYAKEKPKVLVSCNF